MKSRFRKTGLAMATCLVTGLVTGLTAVSAHSMNLLEAYQLALDQDATIRASRATLAAGRERLPQARSQLLPSVQATFSRNTNDVDTTTPNFLGQDTTTNSNYKSFGNTVSLRQPLFSLQRYFQYEQAKDQVADAEATRLRGSAEALAARFPGLPVYPVEADFMRRVELPRQVESLPKLGFFPGSTIGNMIARTATDLLRSMRETLGEGALLLIGMDLVKDEDVLLAAYDDAAGVTAQFNLNLLTRINHELDGDIPVDAFRHEARWNDTFARIEMHLVARRGVTFTVSEQTFTMREGESIHTENSHKFTKRSGQMLLAAGGWEPRARWTDRAGQFALVLAEAPRLRRLLCNPLPPFSATLAELARDRERLLP